MAQIFGPRANPLSRLSVYGAFGAMALFVVGLAIYSRSPYPSFIHNSPDQPVPFSHQLHAGVLKIDCRYCHSAVETSSVASLPPTQTCMTCHSQVSWRLVTGWSSSPAHDLQLLTRSAYRSGGSRGARNDAGASRQPVAGNVW